MPPRLRNLLHSGECETLDYKHEIASPAKIAKTIVSFANHLGGTILVGVGDDATVKGINPAEEQYMLTQAATLFCRPVVSPVIREHTVGRKNVLEVHIPEGPEKPYCAKGTDGKWWAYIRVGDSTRLASKILVEVLKKRNRPSGTQIRYTVNEQFLLRHLDKHERITLDAYCELSGVPRRRAQKVIIGLVTIDCIELRHDERGEYYTLK